MTETNQPPSATVGSGPSAAAATSSTSSSSSSSGSTNATGGASGVGGGTTAGTGGDPGTGGTTGSGGGPGAMDAAPPGDAPSPPADAAIPPSDASGDARDLIREMLARFKPAEIEMKYRELEAMSHPDRSTKSPNYLKATEWVRDMIMAEAPAAVVRFDEQNGYRNVEISIKGTDPAAGMYIIGGHLDGVKSTTAMDDNGSGSLGTALIARAMAHYRFKSEIRCVLFDAEEIGLVGSDLYAKALKASGCQPQTCLKLYVNLDMVGFDPNNRSMMRVWTDVMEVQQLYAKVNTDYMLGLSLSPSGGACHRSDDCSFEEQGYPVIYQFEGSATPYRHMPSDTADTLNYTTLNKILQIAAGTVATAAGIHARVP